MRAKFLSVIRSGMDLASPVLELSAEDCKELLRIGRRQSVQPIILRGLKKLNAPLDKIENINAVGLRDLRNYVLQNDALCKISEVLEAAQIPYIPLKGAVLRSLYPTPELRTSCDIDVLVREDDVEKAVSVIETGTDFKTVRRCYHDISMVNSAIHLELHFSIKEDMKGIDQLLERVWDYAEPFEDGFRYVLTPEYQVFHVIAHMSYHMVNGGLGIRPYIDLWLLRTKTFYDEEEVRLMCNRCNVLVFYEKCCKLVDAWMTGEPIPEDLVMSEDYALNGGVYGDILNRLASNQREHRGVSYYFHRVFMSRSLLETEYPRLKKKPFLLPFYQIRRWLKLLNPQKRRKAIKEFRIVKTMSAETIDSFDQLLTDLGL